MRVGQKMPQMGFEIEAASVPMTKEAHPGRDEAGRFDEGNDGGAPKKEESSAKRKRTLEADLLQIEKDEKEGRLCRAEDVRDIYAQFIRAVKATLDGLTPSASSAVATAMKLDAPGLATVTEAVKAQVDAARQSIVAEWQRIGRENHATRQ